MVQFELTTVAAWWGAIIATLVLVWDFYKWSNRGARLEYDVKTNMNTFGDPTTSGNTYVTVRVSNTGDRSTTIENMGFLHYRTWVHRVARKPVYAAVVTNVGAPNPIPFEIKPGNIWDGMAQQDDDLITKANKGRLYCCIYHSGSKKPIMRRVKKINSA
jgi:hypothetical protein